MRGWERLRAGWVVKATKNPVITKTGLDTLRYICSNWFAIRFSEKLGWGEDVLEILLLLRSQLHANTITLPQ